VHQAYNKNYVLFISFGMHAPRDINRLLR